MRYVLLVMIVFVATVSCKLMVKKDESDKNKPNSSSMTKEFSPVAWAPATTVYEVNVRQFSPEGTFNAFADALPRLKEMGVQTLWFMPIYPIGVVHRKGTLGSYYSIRDYKAVSSDYGTAEDFKNLVNLAHEKGFKVMLDWVANHTAWDHVWTKTHPEFYSKDSAGGFRPPYPDWADVIDLDFDNTALHDAMIDAMKYWVTEFDIDGFRCDMAHLVPLDFWRRARTEIDAVKPLFWLAETEEPAYHEVFDASYTWEFLHKMEAFWRQETTIAGLDSVLFKYDTLFPKGALRLYFTSNHDENSHSGSEYERMGEAARAFAVLCATWDGIPLVYCGQELPNKKRLAFFEKDAIEWTGRNELHDLYRTLFTLHATHPALRAGDSTVSTHRLRTSDDGRVFAFLRRKGDREILVVLNLSSHQDLHFDITDDKLSGTFKNVFSGAANDFNAGKSFEMQPWEFLVYEK